MDSPVFSRQFTPQKVTIKLMDGMIVQGKINLSHGGKTFSRASDLFIKIHDPFIVVVGATIGAQKEQVLILNKSSIMWILPEEEGQFEEII